MLHGGCSGNNLLCYNSIQFGIHISALKTLHMTENADVCLPAAGTVQDPAPVVAALVLAAGNNTKA
jgi:hypothetical protein